MNITLLFVLSLIHVLLSGIGNASILKKIGVEVKLDLPGVGSNFQVGIRLFYERPPRLKTDDVVL